LTLIGRRAPTEREEQRLAPLRARGVHVACRQADVACYEQIRTIVEQLESSSGPLRGVFHLAGLLDDGVLLQLSPERFGRVMSPKAAGAWNLHRATVSCRLDHFVMFSSAASLLGSSGQGNYAAANAFLDGLAHWRRTQGLPALAINWGGWEVGGMASSPLRREELSRRGIGLLQPQDAWLVFERLLRQEEPQLAVMSVDWPVALKPFGHHVPAMVSAFAAPDVPSTEPAGDESDLLSDLMAAPAEARVDLLTDYFRKRLAQVTGLDAGAISTTQPLNELGLDSLMVFELKNAIEARMAITIPIMRFFENPSLRQLAEWSLELHESERSAPPSDAATSAAVAAAMAAATKHGEGLP